MTTRMKVEELLTNLNPQQKEIVQYNDGPQLVIAGAGSGKTRVLTYKLAYLIQQGLAPWSVLALTFTNKAANEMKERVGLLMGIDNARMIQMGTFHSIFLRILRVEATAIGFKSNFTIYDDSDSRSLVTAIVKEMGLSDKTYKASTVLSRIGMAKNSLITPEKYIADIRLAERDRQAKMPAIGEIYKMYANRCRTANALDFDDMLLFTHQLFSQNAEICEKYSARFAYILVDEYQDTNFAQQSIVSLLTRHNRHVCVVGDDAQSIYAFRGANIDNMLDFQRIYPDAKIFKLERNYRSTKNIVNAANCLISHNQRQIHKDSFSENEEGEKVRIHQVYSDKEESAFVAKELKRIRRSEGLAYSDISILYRTNAQSRVLEEELRRIGVPYHIYGGLSFYQRKEIKDILAYFRLVANSDDDEALKRIINYPTRGIGATTMSKLVDAAHAHNVSVWTVLENPNLYGVEFNRGTQSKLSSFCEMMKNFISLREEKDAYELGDMIIKESGISAVLSADKTPEELVRYENVGEFVSGLKEFVDSKREEGKEDETAITYFMQEIVLVTDSEEVEDAMSEKDGGMVSLMTIHASKGLEFPVVFIVGVEENIFPSLRSCNSLRELEEERRLLYVAITRAQTHCIITFARSRYQYGNMSFNPPSRFLKEFANSYVSYEGLAPLSAKRTETASQSRPINKLSEIRTMFPRRDSSISTSISQISQRVLPKTASALKSEPSCSLREGVVIEHQRFGVGRILKIEGLGENAKATVDFQNVGLKQLLLKFSKITVIG